MNRQVSLCFLLGLVTVGFACGKSEAPGESSTKAADPGVATTPMLVAPTKTSSKQVPIATPTNSPTGVARFSLKLVDSGKLKEASAKNGAALEAQRAGDLAGAIKLYQQALEADPGHVIARYNLASAHSLEGNRATALALLSQLASKTGCAVCQGRLVRAKQDKDFAALHSDESFKSLTRRRDC